MCVAYCAECMFSASICPHASICIHALHADGDICMTFIFACHVYDVYVHNISIFMVHGVGVRASHE